MRCYQDDNDKKITWVQKISNKRLVIKSLIKSLLGFSEHNIVTQEICGKYIKKKGIQIS